MPAPSPRACGVIGIWPVTHVANVCAYADSIARMVDVAGVDCVGIGTDQMGPAGAERDAELRRRAAAGPPCRRDSRHPRTAKLLGGNYRRVFETCVA